MEHVTVTDSPGDLPDLPDLPALAEVLDAVPDPRSRRGRRYRLGPLLALSLLAVLSGATSLARITRFIAGYDPQLRQRAGLPGAVRLTANTLGRLLTGLAVDGKTLRGSRTAAGTAVHLLAATRHNTQTVLAQRRIDTKSNEIPAEGGTDSKGGLLGPMAYLEPEGEADQSMPGVSLQE
ncbi:transposase family protein [Nonomuraea fuscirosea]|uniref:transposase family protein n=1 Tax=Nonomuraea fuscirosea TaxID=1291556 RepID=UPI00344AC064